MVSSFVPHSMCAKVERITTKTGCTLCINWTISFKVRGFQTKTHVFQKNLIFFMHLMIYFELKGPLVPGDQPENLIYLGNLEFYIFLFFSKSKLIIASA